MAADADPDADARAHRHRWIWVSAVLGVVVIGALVWALTVKSDRDSAQDELERTSQQLSSAEQELEESQQQIEELESEETTERRRKAVGALGAAGGIAAAKRVYEDLTEQLGVTEEELETTTEDLESANQAAAEAADSAEAAEKKASQADNAADKAQAETEQAQAEAQAEKAKSAVVADCARAYVAAFGGLFEGDDPSEQAPGVQKQFADITDDCKGALAGG